MSQDPNNIEAAPQSPVEKGINKGQVSEGSPLTPLTTTEGTPYHIPEEGSLGLLAMGYAGIMLWRDKKYNSSWKPEKET